MFGKTKTTDVWFEVMKPTTSTGMRRLLAFVCTTLIASNVSLASGGWVIERDERPDSPLLKERKAIALTTEQQEQRAIAQAYQQALQEEQQRIRQFWPLPETSSQTRWVVYSANYSTRKVVDFERNQVEISIDGLYSGTRLDFAGMSKQVQTELENTLHTTLQQAIDQDPIQTAVNAAIARAGNSQSLIRHGNELVLGELFANAKPSAEEISRRAMALMRNASIRYQAQTASTAAVPVSLGKKLTYVIPLPDNRIRRKAQEYSAFVQESAEHFALAEDVILAVIHTESHFNPLARSHIPAFGLMQIVPSSAGRDAAAKLQRDPGILTAEYLYDPKRNIETGSAYLSVIYYDYLKDIKNPVSRLYYALAAYNGGASSVAQAFVEKPSFQDAVKVINQMTPEQVLERLIKAGPNEETRKYVGSVLKNRKYYVKS